LITASRLEKNDDLIIFPGMVESGEVLGNQIKSHSM
jgi:hypothetical protein